MEIFARFFVVVFVGLLAACEQGVLGPTQEDFKQVKAGMSRQQVHDLLGQPDQVDSASIGSLSGTSEMWKGEDHRLSVQYLNGEVKYTDIEPLEEQPQAQETVSGDSANEGDTAATTR